MSAPQSPPPPDPVHVMRREHYKRMCEEFEAEQNKKEN